MAIVAYVTPHHELIQRKFEVLVPMHYHPGGRADYDPLARMVTIDDRPNIPFVHIENPHAKGRVFYEIPILIDMKERGVPFTFMDWADTVHCFDTIDRYLIYVYDYIERRSEEHVNFCRRLIKLREGVYPLWFKFMRENPTAEDELYAGGSKKDDIVNFMARMLGKGIETADPVLRRRKPPYDLEALQVVKQEVVVSPTSDNFMAGLGISTVKKDEILSDSGNGFDFNAFLNGNLNK
jgi:hypothetical protein